MLDNGERYVIIINSKKEELSLITLFHNLYIYWVNKIHSPFYAMTLEDKINRIIKTNYTYPQKIELYYEETEQYWVYYYVSSNSANYIELTVTQLIRKQKLEKLNSL